MPQAKNTTTEASPARNRQVISLPADLAKRVKDKGAEMEEAVFNVTRVRPQLGLSDIAQALIAQALDAAEATPNGDTDTGTDEKS